MILNNKNYYNNDDRKFASAEDVESMINRLYEVDPSRKEFVEKIKSQFPLFNKVNIEGSNQALKTFTSIDNNKTDIDLSLRDITNIDIKRVAGQDERYRLYLTVLTSDGKESMKNIPAIYKATSEFLDKYLSFKKAAYAALDANGRDAVLEFIEKNQLNSNVSKKKNKLRFIDDQAGNTYLRAVVSSGYKLYDNAVVLYLSFFVISSLANTLNKKFKITEMTVTDSKLYATFLEKDAVRVAKDVFVQVGLRIRNSELGDGAARFESIYKISTTKGKKFTILQDELSIVNHKYNPGTVATSLQKLHSFDLQINDIIKVVKRTVWLRKLTRDDLNYITTNISHLRSLPKELREAIVKDLDTTEVVNKTFTLLDLFDKLDRYADQKIPELRFILEGRFNYWLRNKFN